MLRRIGHAGDTLVEVMISMAIIALVLGSSYSLAIRATNTGRQAQERVEATKLIEGQIEKLKYRSTVADFWLPSKDYMSGNPFCVTNSSTISTRIPTSGLNVSTDVLTDNFADYPLVGCQTSNGRYNMSIFYNPAPTSNDTFTFKIRWDRLGGGRDEVKIYYRMHQ